MLAGGPVKRAYAQRLKSVRPDEDPVGFQKLNGAYREALAYLAWNARAKAEEEADRHSVVDGDARSLEEPAQNAAAPQNGVDVDRAGVRQSSPAPFVLDLEAFFGGFRTEAETLAPDALRQWLVSQTQDWPINAKSIAAHHLIEDFAAYEPDISIEQFEAIADFLNLDDVLLGVDPLALEQLRQRIRDQRLGRKRQATLQGLLAPQNRRRLADYMAWTGRGKWRGLTTRVVAWLLTSTNAYGWAMALRPMPFVTRTVIAFLHGLDEGRFDALAPAIDPPTVAFWEWADARRTRNRPLRYAVTLVLAVLILEDLSVLLRSSDVPPSVATPALPHARPTASNPLNLIRAAEARFQAASDLDKKGDGSGVAAAYEKLIAETKWEDSARLRKIVAMAMYNRANTLKDLNRIAEADAQFTTLGRTFSFKYADEADLQIWVARGLFNQGNLWFDQRDMIRAADHFLRVLNLYGDRQSNAFRAQIAKSIFNLGIVHRDTGDRERARANFQDLLRRFPAVAGPPDDETKTIERLIGRANEELQGLP